MVFELNQFNVSHTFSAVFLFVPALKCILRFRDHIYKLISNRQRSQREIFLKLSHRPSPFDSNYSSIIRGSYFYYIRRKIPTFVPHSGTTYIPYVTAFNLGYKVVADGNYSQFNNLTDGKSTVLMKFICISRVSER